MKPLRKHYTYQIYKTKILNLAESLGFHIQTYSPYADYPTLQTILIYNDALENSSEAYLQISGTHGVEGAAGAEIQLHLLEEKGQELLKSSKGFLMIFALNPFGFHFLRRTSFENIDLNRNTGDGLTTVPSNEIQKWLRPLWKSQNLWNQTRGITQALSLSLFKGLSPLVKVFAEGQSLEPQGLFYTGTQKAIEIKTLLQHLTPFLKNKKSLFILDLHTGLGKLFEEQLIHCAGSASKAKSFFSRPIEIPGEKPLSYRGFGLLSDRFALEFPNCELFFTVQEFGVKSTAHSFLALVLENQYHWSHFQRLSEALYIKHPIKDVLFDTFFSTNPDWLKWLQTTGTIRFMELFEGSNL